MTKNIFIVGVGGVTCGGKTTIVNELNKLLPNTKFFSQDDYFLPVDDPRHIWIPEINHINFDILSSLDMEKMYADIMDYIKDKQIVKKLELHKHSTPVGNSEHLLEDISKKIKDKNIEILLIEGFCIFNYKPFQNLFTLMYYVTLSKDECYKRRVQRVYDPPDCPGYFEICAWPEHIKQLIEVQATFNNITFFNEFSVSPVNKILNDILDNL